VSNVVGFPAQCFLCEPDERLVFARKGSFFAMLGLGPLGEGYSLIATRDHVPSMLDLDAAGTDELTRFTRRVRSILGARGYPPAVLTEHGRVAACVHAVTAAHEPHCLHAHRLLFPGASVVDLRLIASGVESYRDFRTARGAFDWPGQYLYSEAPDESCSIAPAPRRLPRQLLRRMVAQSLGMEFAADWRTQPGLEVVEAGRRRLAG
jgi:hypothetical protein